MRAAAALDVFWGDEWVGTAFDETPLAFAYAAPWLARREPMALAAIALQAGTSQAPAVQAFFENLLPEGEQRDLLAQQHQASTLFAMLRAVAGDTAGSFVILPSGQLPQTPSYQPTTWGLLRQQLTSTSASAIGLKGQHARISLAGAQDKAAIAIFEDDQPRLPRGTSPSTHILKPNIQRLPKVWHSAANEAIIMATASTCGLPTAAGFYEPLTQACVIQRFDRVVQNNRHIERLVQYDFCQLVGTLSDKKYEKEGGPSLATCARLIRQHSVQPAVDLKNLVAWVFFNLYVGNHDSHAKNLSLYQRPGLGLVLTPFYDLMSTQLYPGLSPEFAFAIGGQTHPAQITPQHVRAMAEQLGMQPSFVARMARDLATKLPAALKQAHQHIRPALSPSARTLAERLERFVLANTRKMLGRVVEG